MDPRPACLAGVKVWEASTTRLPQQPCKSAKLSLPGTRIGKGRFAGARPVLTTDVQPLEPMLALRKLEGICRIHLAVFSLFLVS